MKDGKFQHTPNDKYFLYIAATNTLVRHIGIYPNGHTHLK
jgi:hypothetical protein